MITRGQREGLDCEAFCRDSQHTLTHFKYQLDPLNASLKSWLRTRCSSAERSLDPGGSTRQPHALRCDRVTLGSHFWLVGSVNLTACMHGSPSIRFSQRLLLSTRDGWSSWVSTESKSQSHRSTSHPQPYPIDCHRHFRHQRRRTNQVSSYHPSRSTDWTRSHSHWNTLWSTHPALASQDRVSTSPRSSIWAAGKRHLGLWPWILRDVGLPIHRPGDAQWVLSWRRTGIFCIDRRSKRSRRTSQPLMTGSWDLLSQPLWSASLCTRGWAQLPRR